MTEVPLGEPGRLYIQTVLRDCVGAAALLVETVSSAGEIFAPLPSGTSYDRALQFEFGGLSARSHALDWLFEDLTNKGGGTLLVQDIWLKPDDLTVKRAKIETYFTDGSQVYYYLPLASLSPARLLNLYKQVSSFQFVGFHIAGDLALSVEDKNEHRVSAVRIQEFAPLATTVYISAYDQEAWVVWRSARATT